MNLRPCKHLSILLIGMCLEHLLILNHTDRSAGDAVIIGHEEENYIVSMAGAEAPGFDSSRDTNVGQGEMSVMMMPVPMRRSKVTTVPPADRQMGSCSVNGKDCRMARIITSSWSDVDGSDFDSDDDEIHAYENPVRILS